MADTDCGSEQPHPQSEPRQLKRILGTSGLVAFGLAYLVPLTVFTTFGSASRLTGGHVPTAYLVTTAAMFFTALSYAALVRLLPSAGSTFAYASRAFGPRAGFIAGWTLLLDYLLLPAINYVIIGIYLNAQFPEIPAAAFALVAIIFVTWLNVVGISVVRNVSLALVVSQLAFAATFVYLAFSRADSPASLLAPFYSDGMAWSGIFAGAAILCLSFLGFDAISTLSEEARDPRRTVPRAILLTTLGGGLLFVVLSCAASLALPDWKTVEVSDAAGIEVVAPLGGTLLIGFFLSTYIAGCVASAVAAQASVSRILYAMGRDGKLPRQLFGVLSERFLTPVRSILVVAALSLLVLFVTLDTLASVISFGALFAFSVVNLSVLKIFLVDRPEGAHGSILRHGLCPAVGCALTAWLWFSLSGSALLVGLSWLAAGAIYLLTRRGAEAGRDAAAISIPTQ
jgi:putrescine importer